MSAGDTDWMWTVQGLLAWRFGKTRNSIIGVGNRHRDIKYTTYDVIRLDKTHSGFGVGLNVGC